MKIKMWIIIILLISACVSLPAGAASKETKVEERYPGLSLGILKSAILAPMEDGVLLTFGDITIRESELESRIEQTDPSIRPQLKKNLFFILEQEVTQKVLLKEAKASGVSSNRTDDQKIIQSHLEKIGESAKVNDAEVKTFYDQNKEMVGNMPFEQVKDGIHGFMMQHKQQSIIDSYILSLGDREKIRINSDWVKIQYGFAKDNPVDKARSSGKPSMIEFGAKGCIPCDMMQPILDNLRKKYPNQLNVIFVHVREEQILGAKFGIRSIPVQAFFDKNGKEVFRHEGFYPEAEILKQLKKMGLN